MAIHAASTQGFDTGLEIIPVGINYSFHRFRADVIISVGESTPIKAYEETYKQNSNKAIAAITRDIEKKFSATVIYVDQANRTDPSRIVFNSLTIADFFFFSDRYRK